MKRSDYYFTRSITTGYVYGIYQKIDGQLVKEGDVTTSTMIRSNKTMESVITEYFKSLGEIFRGCKKICMRIGSYKYIRIRNQDRRRFPKSSRKIEE